MRVAVVPGERAVAWRRASPVCLGERFQFLLRYDTSGATHGHIIAPTWTYLLEGTKGKSMQ